ASIELARRDVRADGAPFRLAGGPTIPLLACIVVIWLATNAALADALAAGAMLAAAVALFGVNKLVRRRFATAPVLVTSRPGSGQAPGNPAAPSPPRPLD